MISYGIKINTNRKTVLNDVLAFIPGDDRLQLKWCLLFIKGTHFNGDLLELEKEVNNSQHGKMLSWKELEEIVGNLADPWDLLIVGNQTENEIVSKSMDEEIIYHSSKYVIDFVDSSYFVVYSSNKLYIDIIIKNCIQQKMSYQLE